MDKVRIFGTQYYATFDGKILDINDNPVKLHIQKGYETFKYKNKNYLVHRVVAECFIKQSKKAVIHVDGNKLNNAAWNLEYVAHRDVFRTKCFIDDLKKLSPELLEAITEKLKHGGDKYRLARTFHLSPGALDFLDNQIYLEESEK